MLLRYFCLTLLLFCAGGLRAAELDIVIDTAERFARLQTQGLPGKVQLTVGKLDQDHISLDVSFDGPMPESLPFAALRSMYATEFNADAARAAWREKDGKSWKESTILDFPGASLSEFWAGRLTPSRHNLSAPDMIFSRFRAETAD